MYACAYIVYVVSCPVCAGMNLGFNTLTQRGSYKPSIIYFVRGQLLMRSGLLTTRKYKLVFVIYSSNLESKVLFSDTGCCKKPWHRTYHIMKVWEMTPVCSVLDRQVYFLSFCANNLLAGLWQGRSDQLRPIHRCLSVFKYHSTTFIMSQQRRKQLLVD